MASYEENVNESFEDAWLAINQDALHYQALHETTPSITNIDVSQAPGPHNRFVFAFPFGSGLVPQRVNQPSVGAPGILPYTHEGISINEEAYNQFQLPSFPNSLSFVDASSGMQPQLAYSSRPATGYNMVPGMHNLGTYLTSPSYFPGPSFSPIPSTASTSITPNQVDISAATFTPPTPLQLQASTNIAAAASRAKSSRRAAEEHTAPRSTERCTAQRAAEDRILLESRAKHISYAAIKKSLKSNVAESTLRGRHRQLTLAPKDRERKPCWSDNDINLLIKAVPLFRKSTGKPKVLWEGVGKYILDHGGSRKFSGKTCHVKYKEYTGRDY